MQQSRQMTFAPHETFRLKIYRECHPIRKMALAAGCLEKHPGNRLLIPPMEKLPFEVESLPRLQRFHHDPRYFGLRAATQTSAGSCQVLRSHPR